MGEFQNSIVWYSAKRLVQGIPMVIVVVLFCFVVIQLAPGTPISMISGSDGITQEQQQLLEEQWGLNEPLAKQSWVYLKNMLSFDLGISYRQGRPVIDIILERLPATLLLMLPALAIAVLLGVSVGIYCSRRMNSFSDSIATVVTLAGYSVPLFWIAQLLILVFSMKLRLFPVSGLTDLRAGYTGLALVWDMFKHLVLPGTCLVFYYSAMILRVTRTKMAEVLKSDYIKTARAKGLSEGEVIRNHALRNALAPVITVVGMELGSIVMGATVVESVFGYPGTGRLIYDAVTKRDYPLIAGSFFFISIMVIVVNVIVDIIYAVIDPQVRYN